MIQNETIHGPSDVERGSDGNEAGRHHFALAHRASTCAWLYNQQDLCKIRPRKIILNVLQSLNTYFAKVAYPGVASRTPCNHRRACPPGSSAVEAYAAVFNAPLKAPAHGSVRSKFPDRKSEMPCDRAGLTTIQPYHTNAIWGGIVGGVCGVV